MKYPLTPKMVNSFTTPNPTACNNIFLHASAVETDSLCTSNLYKTNRQQSIKKTIDSSFTSITTGKTLIYPNPAVNSTNVLLNIVKAGNTEVFVTDVTGKRIVTLFNGLADKGFKTLRLNTSGMSSGQYFIIVAQGTNREVKKLQVLH
ncbi:T9SS type A sorting domain-containing protein [Phnomibacter sp. MR]|uniref:T9SS type A sorting domain-containing protein n=1 Tax=Phnomibacter sp. MR TaxID=3042318 RepID=UPI003A7FDB66